MAVRSARKEQASRAEVRLASVRQDIPCLDRLIHEKLRLGIVSALAAAPTLTFSELKKLLDTTDGNLSVHARKLEEAGYVECVKSFEGRVPKSEYRLTETGRKALGRYLDHMEALVKAMRGSK
ncbi:MAG: transcriptional regulator [Bryobacteraceae bacterium]|jgi:DNA-binding HxlR family transcriptional regulator|nr:transcriptional regulator [Bryobacteraceae bacterium]